MFPQSKISSYTPIVSDVSDEDLVETVKQLKKSENVIVPTPLTICTMPFDVFKVTRGCQSCSTRKSVKSPNIYKFNPIRSSEAMTELSKKRLVSLICAVFIFLCCPPPKKQLSLFASNYGWTFFNWYFSIQESSKANMWWAVGTYNRWRAFRSEIFHQRYTTKTTHYNREIRPIDVSAKDVDELQTDLYDFIVEIRKENGEKYPSSSMYDLISGLSLYLEREHGFTNKLVSGAFRAVRNMLDNVMKERTAEGLGGGQRGTPSWMNMSKYRGRRV